MNEIYIEKLAEKVKQGKLAIEDIKDEQVRAKVEEALK